MAAPAPNQQSPQTQAQAAAPQPQPVRFRPHFQNLLGCTLFDDNLRTLSDFLFAHCNTPDIEIEGKLGLVISKKRDARIYIDGVKSLICLATDEVEAQFAAEVDANMFRHINENLLQRRYRDDASRARHSGQKPQWTYAHSHTTDKFYTVGNDRVRVSYDDATGAVLACVVKEKVAHTDWWNGKPKCIDFRISANRERKVDLPRGECDQLRRKDRLSYHFDLFAVELTRVELFHCTNGVAGDKAASTSFEVEVELTPDALTFLRGEAAKVRVGQANEFVRVAGSMLDTMRTLAQYALPNQLPPGWKPAAPLAPAPSAAQQAPQAAQQASATKKRPREEEEASKEEYGRVWS